MSTHNICLYKEVDKMYSSMKATELLDCALIGVCAVIRSNTIIYHGYGGWPGSSLFCIMYIDV